MMRCFDEFKKKLSKKKKKKFKKIDKNKPGYFHTNFNSKTYPSNKRFVIFVDRRSKNDVITFLEPPYVSDTIPPNHVPEWGYEAVALCIVPRKGYGDGTKFLQSHMLKEHEKTIRVKL